MKFPILTTVSIAAMAISTPAFGQNVVEGSQSGNRNTARVEQAGSNEANVTQAGEDNETRVLQIQLSGNEAEVSQRGGTRNTISVVQQGSNGFAGVVQDLNTSENEAFIGQRTRTDQNSARIIQTSEFNMPALRNSARISQNSGANNSATSFQTGSDGIILTVQSGDFNTLNASTENNNNSVFVQQIGTNNRTNAASGLEISGEFSRISSRTFGSNNFSSAFQIGTESTTELLQRGDANTSLVMQGFTSQDRNNIVNVEQRGDGNLSDIRQATRFSDDTMTDETDEGLSGGSDNFALVTQSGDLNQSVLEQQGSGNTALITQSGNENEVDLLQDGFGNNATISQGGDGNIVNLEQVGSGNSFTVIQ